MAKTGIVKCRGCLLMGSARIMKPLRGRIRNLFQKCCGIDEILSDEPRYICGHCLKSTEAWVANERFRKVNPVTNHITSVPHPVSSIP